MGLLSKRGIARGNLQLLGFHPLLHKESPRKVYDGAQDPERETLQGTQRVEYLVEEDQKSTPTKGLVEGAEDETGWTLQLLWYQRKHEMSSSVLLRGIETNVQVDKQEGPKEEYDV